MEDGQIRLQESQIQFILEKIPSREIKDYKKIYQLSGKHSICPLNYLGVLSDRLILKKEDGTSFEVQCIPDDERKILVTQLRNNLSKYHYRIDEINSGVRVVLPWHSTGKILSGVGADLICGTIERNLEKILFVPCDGFSGEKLKQAVAKAKTKFKKQYGSECTYPEKISVLTKNISLPVFTGYYDWKYLHFLINEKPTPDQLKVLDSLYLFIRNGINVYEIAIADLIKLVTRHTGISAKKIRRYLQENPSTLQTRLYHGWVMSTIPKQFIKQKPRIPGLGAFTQRSIIISDETNKIIAEKMIKPGHFAATEEVIDYCARTLFLKEIQITDLKNPKMIEGNTGVTMFDKILDHDVIVRIVDGESFCEFHNMSHPQCLHIRKAELFDKYPRPPQLPDTDNINIKHKESNFTYYISKKLEEKIQNWIKRADKKLRINTVSEAVEYSVVNTFHTGFNK